MNQQVFISNQVALEESRLKLRLAVAEQNAKYNATLPEKAKKMSDRQLLDAIYVKLYTLT